ncbi:MAG: site-specific DNA-methyltransferase [Anaerolineae bacterium]|nr:site-specific DNA-methyltransferase [Anaerolineae bacterium]
MMTSQLTAHASSPMQLSLLEANGQSAANNGSAAFNDPAFAGNKKLPVHRWVPWIAGFSSDFVRDVLERYANGNSTVLDPFSGVGTTLVESVLFGCNTCGFEINPYAALASRVKSHSHQINATLLDDYIERFKSFYAESARADYLPQSHPPKGFNTRSPFYSPKVLHKVLIFLDYLALIQAADIRDLFRLAFASTMVSYSNYSYEPSLGRRTSAGKSELLDGLVGEVIARKLTEFSEDIRWFQAHKPQKETEIKIVEASFFEYEKYLAAGSIDLIITSPPYLNNYHYNRNTRPHLYWLDFVEQPGDFKNLEYANFGKYWQTVREQTRLELDFCLPDSDLPQKLELLRAQKPEKGIYGGNGWANYAAAYFNDCYKFVSGIQYALKPGGSALVVIGNSILQGILIPTDQYLGAIAQRVGLELVRIDIPRATRVGNSIIQSDVRTVKAKKSHQLYEAIVELRKV